MGLAAKIKAAMKIAMPQSRAGTKDGQVVADAIDSVTAKMEAVEALSALGTTTDLVGVDGSGSNAAPLAGTEARLDAIEAKIDAVIAALKT